MSTRSRGALGGLALLGSLLWYEPTIAEGVAAALGALGRRWMAFSLTYPVLSTLILAATSVVVALPLGLAVVKA